MENKKTFGAYILQRRKALGMTQRQFAERLYVTESAVSKWERGLSYPDITLLQTICDVLQISEYELLNGGEDTKRKQSEQLAARYLRLTRNYRIAQYVLYGGALLGCAIGNLAGGHTLDWFFIVLTALMMAASITLLPALTALHARLSRYGGVLSLTAFTVSLELLLLVCCLYSGGDWFFVAGVPVLFGITLVALPFILPHLPLPQQLADKKTSLYLLAETALLLLLLLVCCLYTGGNWFWITAVSVLFGLGFLILPCLLHQFLQDTPLGRHRLLLYTAIQSILLSGVLLGAAFYTGMPSQLRLSLPVAGLCLLLPWGLVAAGRYLPANGWFRASACSAWTCLWLWLAPLGLDRLISDYYGYGEYAYPLFPPLNFMVWSGNQIAYNVIALILIAFAAAALLFACLGCSKLRRSRTSGT